MKIRSIKKSKFRRIVRDNTSIAGVLRDLGLVPRGGNYKTVHCYVKKWHINTKHWLGKGHLKGKHHSWSVKPSLNKVLIKDSPYSSSFHLRNRLIKENILKDKCDECGITHWHGHKLSLHLEHKNGINTDHRRSNISLLCPNCHSLTKSYCGKNKGRYKGKIDRD